MLGIINKGYIPEALWTVCEKVRIQAGQAWLVGGSVRDLTLGVTPKDWDVEVYGLEPDVLQATLKKLGSCEHVGKQFGVTKLWIDGLEIDVALPRKEVKSGLGHKGFTIDSDPYLEPERAVLRRDFTMNAMMFNPLTEQFLDFHGGFEDLKCKRLKHVSKAFVEDPLRPLRAMQFAARFQLILAPETARLCETMLMEAKTLPAPRIWQEWLKWSGSDFPSYGLKALRDMGWGSLYPALQTMVGCPQDVYWHPEGDVWTHTCLVLDAAAQLKTQREFSQQEQTMLLFAALCHDLGKPEATFVDDAGKVCAPQHDKLGVKPSIIFLKSIAAPKWLLVAVQPLVEEHMTHFSGEPTTGAVRRLASRLTPVRLRLWEALTQADACGRTPAPPSRPGLPWLEKAIDVHVSEQKSKAIVTGKLLLSWGMKPSAEMGEVLEKAYAAQMDEVFHDEISAHDWFEKYGVASDGD